MLKDLENFFFSIQQVNCKRHEKGIKIFNIGSNILFGNRALCEDCETEGNIINIKQALELLQRRESCDIVEKIRSFIQNKKLIHQNTVIQFLKELENQFNGWINGFKQKFDRIFEQVNNEFDPFLDLNGKNVNLTKVQFIGELISSDDKIKRISNIKEILAFRIKQESKILIQDIAEIQTYLSPTLQKIENLLGKIQEDEPLNMLVQNEISSNEKYFEEKIEINRTKSLHNQQTTEQIKFLPNQQEERGLRIQFAKFNSSCDRLFLVRESNLIQIIDILSDVQQEEFVCKELQKIKFFNLCPNKHNFIVGDFHKLIVYYLNSNSTLKNKEQIPMDQCLDCFIMENQDGNYKLFVFQKDQISFYIKNKSQMPNLWKKKQTFKTQDTISNFCFNQYGFLAFGSFALQVYYENEQDSWVQINMISNKDLKIQGICSICKLKDQQQKIVSRKGGIRNLPKISQAPKSFPPSENLQKSIESQQNNLEKNCSNIVFITLNLDYECSIYFWEFSQKSFQVTKIYKFNLIPHKFAFREEQLIIFDNLNKKLFLIYYEEQTIKQRQMIFSKKCEFITLSNRQYLANIVNDQFEIISKEVFDQPEKLQSSADCDKLYLFNTQIKMIHK